MFNSIILKKGYERLTENEFKNFAEGDTIWGVDQDPVELKRWSIDQKEAAEAELKKYRCTYDGGHGQIWTIEEYALEYCECDEDGEFVQGSDYELAEKASFCPL